MHIDPTVLIGTTAKFWAGNFKVRCNKPHFLYFSLKCGTEMKYEYMDHRTKRMICPFSRQVNESNTLQSYVQHNKREFNSPFINPGPKDVYCGGWKNETDQLMLFQ